MVTTLKRALQPLFIISKLFGLCSFSIKHENVSYSGTIFSTVVMIAYSTFHIISASDELPSNSNETNFVTITINSFNRYSGIVSLPVIITTGIIYQKEITNALQLVHMVDSIFQEEIGLQIDDSKYSRNIKLSLLIFIITTSALEYFNCLMFIQSYATYNQYCILMCLVPYTVSCITEIQFIAYMQLLKNRLKLINDFFAQFRENTIGNYDKGKNLNMKECRAVNKMFLVKEMRDKIKMPKSIVAQKNAKKVNLHAFVESIIENRKLEVQQGSEYVVLCQRIMKLQKIYTNLEKFLMLIRTAYAPQIITIFTMKFSLLTSMLYACCMILIESISKRVFVDDDLDQLISSSVWIGLLLFEMFVLCYVCHITKIEAKQIGCNVHHFARTIDYHECKLQAKAFSLELLNDRIEFIPMGLFKLDLQFMYNLFGAVSTYLIILIQFDMAQNILTDEEIEKNLEILKTTAITSKSTNLSF